MHLSVETLYGGRVGLGGRVWVGGHVGGLRGTSVVARVRGLVGPTVTDTTH